MIFTQPVCHEFGNLKMPVPLMVGQADRTAIGKELVSKEIGNSLGNYPELGRQATNAMPHAHLIILPNIGHVPQLEDFPRFFGPLKVFLDANSAIKPR